MPPEFEMEIESESEIDGGIRRNLWMRRAV